MVNPAPIIRYIPVPAGELDPKMVAGVAFEAPFTVEVIDRDAAKDSRSKVIVKLKTTSGAEVEVVPLNFPQAKTTGTIDFISPTIDAASGTVQVMIRVRRDRASAVLRPGLAVQVRFKAAP